MTANATQGPPPPRVPEGWKAVWNAQYSEWFFVNMYTKQSQWDKPTEAAHPAGESAPDHPPPSYGPGATGALGSHTTGTSDKSYLSSNNPYAASHGPPGANITEDEKLARKLQDEEESRARAHGGAAANDYYNQSGQSQPGQYGGYPQQGAGYPQSQTPAYDAGVQGSKSKGGLLGKLLGKASGGHSSSTPHAYPQQHGYGQPMGYGGQPGYYQQQPMGGGMMGGMGGGRRPGGGMGTGGALALGAGGGLLGGMMLGEAMGDAGDGGGDGGGDYGGGDGGGDYGGGDGGGDFGGGDGGGDFGGGGDF
jgi:hypothetical protein